MESIVENKLKELVEKYKYYLILFFSIFILFLTLGYEKNSIDYKLYVDSNEINLFHGIYNKDNEHYIHIDDLTSSFEENIYDDKISGKIIITTFNSVQKINKNDDEYTIKMDNEVYFNLKKVLNSLKNNYVVSKNKIYAFNNETVQGEIINNRTELYDKQTNSIIYHVNKGDKVQVVLNENSQNTETVEVVVSIDNSSYYGYVLMDNVKYEQELTQNGNKENKNKVVLVKADEKILSSTDLKYVDMVAINMYRLSGVNTLTKLEYTNNSLNSVKVFATINNGYLSSNYDSSITTRMLNSESNRENVIQKLLEVTKSISGVCVDFANLKTSDKTNFTQFIKELSAVLHANNKEVIVNVPNTQYIDIEQISNIADYVVVQLYTARTTASKTSGPISSLTYVENNLNDILKGKIDSNKLILELPAYSILWTERKGTIINAERYSMKMIEEYLSANDIESVLDSMSGQNYINYTKGITTYKMWLEDEYSMVQKTNLVVKHNLRGVSIYKSGMELTKVYSSILNALKK